jgi:hypothetical protein
MLYSASPFTLQCLPLLSEVRDSMTRYVPRHRRKTLSRPATVWEVIPLGTSFERLHILFVQSSWLLCIQDNNKWVNDKTRRLQKPYNNTASHSRWHAVHITTLPMVLETGIRSIYTSSCPVASELRSDMVTRAALLFPSFANVVSCDRRKKSWQAS